MRVLITNYDLTRRGGTQLFVRDVARKLLEWGHEPVVYSTALGSVAADLRNFTIPVTSDLRTISLTPDVILGNDPLGTMTALHRFPNTAAVFFLHGLGHSPPKFPRIRRYVAVDETCRAKLVYQHAIPPDITELILNAVDLARFRPRPPLPRKPRRAAMFGNQFTDNEQLRAIRTACAAEQIELDHIGRGFENSADSADIPEIVLQQYDLIFARARCALEAMAIGAAVILCGPTRLGGMVTSSVVDRYRPLNFGRRTLMTPIDVAVVRREIARYDAEDAAEVSRRIRATASLDLSVAEIVRVAEEVIEEQQHQERDVAAEYDATATFLRELEPELTRLQRLRTRVARLPLIGRFVAPLAERLIRAMER